MNLSDHQKRVMAAMTIVESPQWRQSGDPSWLTRYDLGMKVNGRSGIQQKTMIALASAGLVECESQDALRLVSDGVCRCGCDRWRLTASGREMVAGWKIAVYSHYGDDNA